MPEEIHGENIRDLLSETKSKMKLKIYENLINNSEKVKYVRFDRIYTGYNLSWHYWAHSGRILACLAGNPFAPKEVKPYIGVLT